MNFISSIPRFPKWNLLWGFKHLCFVQNKWQKLRTKWWKTWKNQPSIFESSVSICLWSFFIKINPKFKSCHSIQGVGHSKTYKIMYFLQNDDIMLHFTLTGSSDQKRIDFFWSTISKQEETDYYSKALFNYINTI